MLGDLRAETDSAIIAGEPAAFRVSFSCAEKVLPGGRVRLLYDYRGIVGKESLAQVSDPGAANYVAADSAQGAPIRLRTYSVAHSYKPAWSAEPECYTWVDLLGPDVSLNCHVVEAAFDQGLPADELVTFRFGANQCGFLLTRKSYRDYPIWAIVDAAGDGTWCAAGETALTVNPGAPARAIVTVPSICAASEAVRPRTQVFDQHFNPVAASPRTPLEAPPGLVRDASGASLRATAPGVHRLAGSPAEGLPVESNPMLVTAAPGGPRLYWGDIHGHCNICDGGVRGPAEYYTWARDVAALDFCALTAHDFGIALGNAAERWQQIRALASEFDAPGRFAALLGWEATHIGLPAGRSVGHKNVIFRGGDAPFFNGSTYGMPRSKVDYRTYEELRALLKGLDCQLIPHHPLNPLTPGGLGTNWNDFWAQRERVVEMHSLWGTSEGMDSPGRTKDAVEGTSVLTALMRGHRLGFVGGSDTHDGRPGNPMEQWTPGATTGLTAVWATGLTRATIYDAIWQRRCYATTGARIILETHVGGLTMGQRRVIAAGDALLKQREVRVFVACTAPFRQVEIVRNGQVIHTIRGDGVQDTLSQVWVDPAPLQGIAMTDAGGRRFVFYYVRVQQEDENSAWSSPVWLDLKPDA